MDFLQNLDAGTAILIVFGLSVVCIIGVILLLGVNILGGALGIVGNLLGGITGLIGGATASPLSCCGCLVVIGLIVVCGGGIFLIVQISGSCGTPDAVNFCTLFGG